MRKPFKEKVPDRGIQIFHLRQKFPQFQYKGKGVWIGTLQPTPLSPIYKIKIVELRHSFPHVYVLEPKIVKDAPHLYSDRSLCLFFPKDFSWSKKSLIAETIVPWTALWLYFYEWWLKTGFWYGESVEHKPTLRN